METTLLIRQSTAADLGALEEIYPLAFPDENLFPVVRDLFREDAQVLSLCALDGGAIAGHVGFTFCHVEAQAPAVALLAPLCVAPHWQKQGIGTALVNEGLKRLSTLGVPKALVLGDPAYYGRFGFAQEDDIAPPYPVPDEWRAGWQSLDLNDDGKTLSGALGVPGIWNDPTLWQP